MSEYESNPRTYQLTVDRLEPHIAMIDAGAFYASAAISLKRLADAAEARNVLMQELIVGFRNMKLNICQGD